jgi:hypothetical protein
LLQLCRRCVETTEVDRRGILLEKTTINKALLVNIGIMATFTASGSAIFAIIGPPMISCIWVLFAGFTITVASPHQLKYVPNLLASHVAGWFWAMTMFFMAGVVTDVFGSFALGIFVAIFVGTIFLLLLHIVFLGNTWFNVLPVIYATIFLWFATQDFAMIVFIAIAFIVGTMLAVFSDVLTAAILRINSKGQ